METVACVACGSPLPITTAGLERRLVVCPACDRVLRVDEAGRVGRSPPADLPPAGVRIEDVGEETRIWLPRARCAVAVARPDLLCGAFAAVVVGALLGWISGSLFGIFAGLGAGFAAALLSAGRRAHLAPLIVHPDRLRSTGGLARPVPFRAVRGLHAYRIRVRGFGNGTIGEAFVVAGRLDDGSVAPIAGPIALPEAALWLEEWIAHRLELPNLGREREAPRPHPPVPGLFLRPGGLEPKAKTRSPAVENGSAPPAARRYAVVPLADGIQIQVAGWPRQMWLRIFVGTLVAPGLGAIAVALALLGLIEVADRVGGLGLVGLGVGFLVAVAAATYVLLAAVLRRPAVIVRPRGVAEVVRPIPMPIWPGLHHLERSRIGAIRVVPPLGSDVDGDAYRVEATDTAGGSPLPIAVDVRDPDEARDLARQVEDALDRSEASPPRPR